MLRCKNIFLALTTTLCAIPSAQGSQNLLQCQYTSGIWWTGCRIVDNAFRFNDDYSFTYTLDFNHDCQGTNASVLVETDLQERVLGRASNWQSTQIDAQNYIKILAADEQQLYGARFRRGCRLEINPSLSKTPSVQTLAMWNQEATLQSKILRNLIREYELAKDFLNLASWDLTKLELLRAKLEQLVAVYPTNIHYRVMLNTVNSAIENRPFDHSNDEIADAQPVLLAELRQELDAEYAAAVVIQQRFLQWQQAINQELQDLLDQINAL